MNILTIPLHIGDWLGGTFGWGATEIGAYFNLTVKHYLEGEKGISADEVELAAIAGCNLRTWRRISPKVLTKFYLKDGLLVNSKVVEKILEIKTMSAQNSANALKRWEKQNAVASNPQSDRNANQSQNPKPLSLAASSDANYGDNPDQTDDGMLPDGWDSAAQKMGLTNVDRRFESWRKFKDISAYPYQRRLWLAWVKKEFSYNGEEVA